MNPARQGGVPLTSTILLPWVAWNAERSTPPFLCAFSGTPHSAIFATRWQRRTDTAAPAWSLRNSVDLQEPPPDATDPGAPHAARGARPPGDDDPARRRRGRFARERGAVPAVGRRHAADRVGRPSGRDRRLLQPPVVRVHGPARRRHHGRRGVGAGARRGGRARVRRGVGGIGPHRASLRDRVPPPPPRRPIPLAPRPRRSRCATTRATSSAGSAPTPTSTTRRPSRRPCAAARTATAACSTPSTRASA